MNSVYITAFFLLSASFCTAIQERSTRTGWEPVQAGDQTNYNYLALLEYAGEKRAPAYRSGSIISPSAVLTYCKGDPEMAYAGLIKAEDKSTAKQKRNVSKVEPHPDPLSALKICILEKKWELTLEVNIVKINPDARSTPLTGCLVLGFGTDAVIAQKQEGVKIDTACTNSRAVGELYSVLEDAQVDNFKIAGTFVGGPAVCGNVQRGINKWFLAGVAEVSPACNVYIDVTEYKDWIDEQIKAAEAGQPGEPVGTNETNANTTSPSSGCSIHSYLNKYSNWKVLLLCLVAIKFLVY